jgi:hypothetical protein
MLPVHETEVIPHLMLVRYRSLSRRSYVSASA